MNNSSVAQGTLFIVATPIGHLDDLSVRARTVLASVDVVLAEDTRRSLTLLRHYGVHAQLESVHEHNEEQRASALVARALAGECFALVSDAGTPLISDPGFTLVQAMHDAGIQVSPVPGPCAAAAAISVAGISSHRFAFEGFLPARKSSRRERLASLAKDTRTLIIYEAPHRAAAAMADIRDLFGDDRPVTIARELTKLHEQIVYGRAGSLADMLVDHVIPQRGEFVFVIEGAPAQGANVTFNDDTERWLKAIASSMSPSDGAKVAAKATGLKRADIYRRLLELRDSS